MVPKCQRCGVELRFVNSCGVFEIFKCPNCGGEELFMSGYLDIAPFLSSREIVREGAVETEA